MSEYTETDFIKVWDFSISEERAAKSPARSNARERERAPLLYLMGDLPETTAADVQTRNEREARKLTDCDRRQAQEADRLAARVRTLTNAAHFDKLVAQRLRLPKEPAYGADFWRNILCEMILDRFWTRHTAAEVANYAAALEADPDMTEYRRRQIPAKAQERLQELGLSEKG